MYLAGINTTHDIACEGFDDTRAEGNIWVACGDAEKPIKAYNQSGQIVEEIPASIGIGSDIWGLAWEQGSKRILWANNKSEKKIYKIDVDGQTDIRTDQDNICSVTDNYVVKVIEGGIKLFIPFNGNSQVTVFDIQGRMLFTFTVKSNTWNTVSRHLFTPGINIICVKNNRKTVVKEFISIK